MDAQSIPRCVGFLRVFSARPGAARERVKVSLKCCEQAGSFEFVLVGLFFDVLENVGGVTSEASRFHSEMVF